MACEAGKCVAGFIAGKSIYEKDWNRAVIDFDAVIEDWNIKTRRFQISHPGFVEPANYCSECGRKLDDKQR